MTLYLYLSLTCGDPITTQGLMGWQVSRPSSTLNICGKSGHEVHLSIYQSINHQSTYMGLSFNESFPPVYRHTRHSFAYLYMLHIPLSAALRQKNGMGIKSHPRLETSGATLYSPNVDKSEKKIWWLLLHENFTWWHRNLDVFLWSQRFHQIAYFLHSSQSEQAVRNMDSRT